MGRKDFIKKQEAQIVEEHGLIYLDNVSKSYSTGSPAINRISLSIKKGEFVFIVGDSGSGKSTLIKLLLRELTATSGSIYVAGKNLSKIKHRNIPKYRRNIGVVFQDFRLLSDRNVFDNVAFAQRIVEKSAKEIRRNVPRILATVGLAGKYKAKINQPSILLADEPTGNLDPKNSWDIMKLLEEINDAGTTVVVVTHNREIVNAMQKRVVTMRKGVIISDEEEGMYIDED